MDYLAVCRIDSPPAKVMAVPLSLEERRSLAACRTDRRRREMDVSRRLTRYSLQQYLALSADPLEWRETGPRYIHPYHKVRLSVAHGKRHAAVALSKENRIGVDVEGLESRPHWRETMTAMYCDEDVEWIGRNAWARQDPAGPGCFLAVWTAREAYAKYAGVSVFDILSKPLLHDAREARDTGSRHHRGAARVEVRLEEHCVVAVCRKSRTSMPPCMSGRSGSLDAVVPYRPDFVFFTGDYD